MSEAQTTGTKFSGDRFTECGSASHSGLGATPGLTGPDRAATMDRRIAGSPDRRIAGSPDRRIAGSPDRPICASVPVMIGAAWRFLRPTSSRPSPPDSSARAAAGVRHAARRPGRAVAAVLLGLPLLLGVAAGAQAQDLALNASTYSSASEGNSGHTDHTFQVTLTQAVAGNVDYMLCFSSGSGGENHATRNDDFRLVKGGVVQNGRRTCHQSVIRAGQTNTATVDLIGIRVLGDTRVEPDEKVDVELKPLIYLGDGTHYGNQVPYDYTDRSQMKYGVRLTAANARQSFTILNDDRPRVTTPPPRKTLYHHSIVVYSDSGSEDPSRGISPNTRRQIRVQLFKNPKYDIPGQVTFKICIRPNSGSTATRDHGGTWNAGEDYRLLVGGGIVNGQCRVGQTFGSDGFSSSRIEIDVRNDQDVEPDETVVLTVELDSPAHRESIQVHPGTYTIRDDDDFGVTDPEVTIDGTGGAVDEGGFAEFRVKIATPPGGSSVRRINVAARVPWTDEVWSSTIVTAGPDARFRVPTYGVTGDYHLCAWVRPGRDYTIGGTSGNAPPTSTDNRRTLTDGNGNPLHNPAYGTRFNVNDGKASSCPSGHTVLVRDTGSDFQMAMDESRAGQAPTTAVTNLQVTAVDANTAKATWDAVPHATGYLVEFESTSALVDPANYVYGSAGNVTGTARSYTHNAAEAMTLTVTVTPEFREDGNVQRFHALAGTATIEVGPGVTQGAGTQDSVQAHSCGTAPLKSDIAGYIGEQADGTPHVTRWKRVLAAFGDDNGYTAMTAAEAQTHADRGWTRWDPVVVALECLENAGGVDPEPEPAPDPEPGITVTGGGGIAEGGDAVFTVHSNPAPSSDLAVTVNVDDDTTSDFLGAGDEGTRTVTILAGRTSATLTLATENDGTDEPDGSVSVTALDGTGYTVGSPGTAAVAVADDDDPPVATPVVGIAGGGGITEGGAASYTLTATPAPAGTITVTVDVTDSGGFAAGGQTGARTVTIGASGTAAFTVATDDDTADEADGSITAALQSGTGYTVAASPDDTASVAVSDDDEPVISISGGSGVTEGVPVVFTLTANPAPHADLTVTLDIAQGGDFAAAGQTGTRQVTIPAGGSIAFEVATVNDSADEPDGSVTATLAAGTGYAVAAPPDDTATVAVADDDAAPAAPEGPSLSVNDVEVKEGPYRRIEFTVTLSEASDRYVSFHYRVRESDPVSARRNVDFWGPVSKQFAGMRPGQTEYRIPAGMVIDDSHDEDPETFEVVLSDANGAAIADGVGVATIVNSDPMPAAWLGRFGRTVAEQALDGVSDRMAAPRTAGVQGTLAGHIDLGSFSSSESGVSGDGDSLPTENNPVIGNGHGWSMKETGWGFENSDGWGLKDAGNWSTREMTLREAVTGSSFTATGREDAMGGSLSFWGRGSESSFDGREGAFTLDGDASTAMLGADYARDGWLLGLALLQSDGEGGYADSGTGPRPASQACSEGMEGRIPCDGAIRTGDGAVESTLTSVVPYGSLRMSDRIGVWGAFGHGTGEVFLRPDTMASGDTGNTLESDITWTMASVGMRGDLLQRQGENGPALALTADALWARTESDGTAELASSESAVTRLRLGLEGSWKVALSGGGNITPKLELGIRHDGGDAETGSGIELGAGVSWSSPAAGIRLDLSGRTLVSHDDGDLEDRGFSADLSFDPDGDTKRGPSFSLRRERGARSEGGLDALFAAGPLSDRAGNTSDGDEENRWTMETAYGFPAFSGRYTGSPHAGMGISGDTRDWSVGWRLTPESGSAADLSFGVRATRRETDDTVPENIFGFEASLRW